MFRFAGQQEANPTYWVLYPLNFPTAPKAPLADGTYRVRWSIASGVGRRLVAEHEFTIEEGMVLIAGPGSQPFEMGKPEPPPPSEPRPAPRRRGPIHTVELVAVNGVPPVIGSWQQIGKGQVQLALRNLGQLALARLLCIVTDLVTTAENSISGISVFFATQPPNAVTVTYPRMFAGSLPLEEGDYEVVWRVSGVPDQASFDLPPYGFRVTTEARE